MDVISAVAAVTFALVSILVAWAAVSAYRLYGGIRLVTCPENAESAIVKIRATRAMASRLAGRDNMYLRSCSRWPERQGCDQACAGQAVAGRGGCRPRALAGR